MLYLCMCVFVYLRICEFVSMKSYCGCRAQWIVDGPALATAGRGEDSCICVFVFVSLRICEFVSIKSYCGYRAQWIVDGPALAAAGRGVERSTSSGRRQSSKCTSLEQSPPSAHQ